MISDTLSDASDEIRRYLDEFPEVYEPVKSEVQDVLSRMAALRVKLDEAPTADR